jgi:hypothetical protein
LENSINIALDITPYRSADGIVQGDKFVMHPFELAMFLVYDIR